VASLLAVYAACFRSYRLAAGERAVVACVASDKLQARIVLKYVVGLLRSTPLLAQCIVNETATAVELRGNVVIEVHNWRTASA
jgi:hypothetical protein